jgi:CRISPR-associated endonuclease Csn1
LAGSKLNLAKAGEFLSLDDEDSKTDISLTDADFDVELENLVATLGDSPVFSIIKNAKFIYDSFQLGKLLGDGNISISKVMMRKYDRFQSDLKDLKYFIKNTHADLYKEIFGSPTKDVGNGKTAEVNNFSKYVGFYKGSKKKINLTPCTREKFLKYLVDELKLQDSNDERDISFKEKIASPDFLKKLNGTENGILPYQLNLYEMDAILKKQAKFYPFLNEIEVLSGASGEQRRVNNIDKIESLLTFKIPYYVGPLYNSNKEGDGRSVHSWVVREEGKIYPWNFDLMVDKDSSAEKFIKRMLNNCTYLSDCYCLPKNSILFSIYNVLNTINKICVNGVGLNDANVEIDGRGEVNLKKEILDGLFLKQRIVTKNQIIKFLEHYGSKDITTSNGKEIESVDLDIRAYYDFKNVFPIEFEKYGLNSVDSLIETYTSRDGGEARKFLDKIESIINDIVIFEDKDILERRLINKRGCDKQTAKKIKSLTYVGYGRISKELLLNIVASDENGEVKGSIIEDIYRSSDNFMEAIQKYNYISLIEEWNKKNMDLDPNSGVADFVDELYINPQSKRAIIQTYHILDELKRILKVPNFDNFKYFIEFARTNKAEKKRTNPRYQIVKKMLEDAAKISKEDYESVKESFEKVDPNSFQSDKYYLYFTQLGVDLYTGEKIDIEDLHKAEFYDIDHIIPRSFIKNDSINNRVLVSQEANREKSDIYPIDRSILRKNKGGYKSAKAFFDKLRKMHLITEEKYAALTRSEMNADELDGFINRQLVATDQSTKGLVQMLTGFCGVSTKNIVYSKAENVSGFRQEFGVVKSRTANNFHHAHDAYLNIVVGDVVNKYFKGHFIRGKSDLDEFKSVNKTANPENIFKSDKPVKNLYGDLVWDVHTMKDKVVDQIERHYDIMTTTMAYTTDNLFSKVTIKPHTKSKGDNMIPIRYSGPYLDVDRYGGLTDYNFGSYSLIEMPNKKGDVDRYLIAIPGAYKDPNDYLVSQGYKNYKMIFPRLKINTVFKDGKKKFCVTGKTGDRFLLQNLNERIFSFDEVNIIRKIEKLIDKVQKLKLSSSKKGDEEDSILNDYFTKDNNKIIISPAMNDRNSVIELSDDELLSLYNSITKMFSKEIYSFSTISAIANELISKKEKFIGLSFYKKCILLKELLQLLQCNSRQTCDLSIIGLKSNTGTLTMCKKLNKTTRVIFESYSGYYTKEI